LKHIPSADNLERTQAEQWQAKPDDEESSLQQGQLHRLLRQGEPHGIGVGEKKSFRASFTAAPYLLPGAPPLLSGIQSYEKPSGVPIAHPMI
jgi:hypothetical protein